MAVDIGSTIQELIQAINEEKGTQYYIKNIGGTCGNSLQGNGSSQYVITKLKNQRKPQISDFVIKIYSTPNDYGQNVIVEQITDIVGSVTVADDDETVTIGSCTHIERYFANGKNGEDGITDIADQYVRIWDLDTGIYRLTYEGTKYIYYYGATNTSMTAKSLVDKPIIYVNSYSSGSSEYRIWVSFTANEGTSSRIISGYTTATYGSVNYKNISSLLTTGQVRNDLTYDINNQSYVLSAYQGYLLKQSIDEINNKIGDSANKIPYFTISTDHPSSETTTIQNLYENIVDVLGAGFPVTLLNVTGYFVKLGVLDIVSRGNVKLVTFMDFGSQSIYSGEVSSTDKISVIFENLKPLATTDVASTTTDGLMSADDKKKLMYHINDDSVETTYLDIGIDDWSAGVYMKKSNGSNVVDIYGDEVTVNDKPIITPSDIDGIDTWYGGMDELFVDAADGICWAELLALYDGSGNAFWNTIAHRRIPITAGHGIEFEPDTDLGIVQINATGGSGGSGNVQQIYQVIDSTGNHEIPIGSKHFEFTITAHGGSAEAAVDFGEVYMAPIDESRTYKVVGNNDGNCWNISCTDTKVLDNDDTPYLYIYESSCILKNSDGSNWIAFETISDVNTNYNSTVTDSSSIGKRLGEVAIGRKIICQGIYDGNPVLAIKFISKSIATGVVTHFTLFRTDGTSTDEKSISEFASLEISCSSQIITPRVVNAKISSIAPSYYTGIDGAINIVDFYISSMSCDAVIIGGYYLL